MPKTEPKPKPGWLKKREEKRKQEEEKTKPSKEQTKSGEKIREKAERKLAKPTSDSKEVTKVLGLDCEMVGVGPQGRDSALARVVIINSYGNIIYDKHVKAKETIVDYRTKFSGIRREDMLGAFHFDEVQREVADLIKERIVVGHGLKNDFAALMLHHPFPLTRDTAKYRGVQRAKGRPHALKYLAKTLLGVKIQTDEHDPAEDARAALLIYKKLKKEWELKIAKKKYGKALGKVKEKKGPGMFGGGEDSSDDADDALPANRKSRFNMDSDDEESGSMEDRSYGEELSDDE